MELEGKYIYGIIETTQDHRFGPIGLQGEEVLTIGMDDLAMVVSHYSSDEDGQVTSSRKNLITHQKVLERLMEEHTVLPMKFGTIAEGVGEINNLLMRHEKGFKMNLQKLDNKVELGVKAFWKDMPSIYNAVLEGNAEIQNKKIEIAGKETTNDLIEIGQMVEKALLDKKEEEAGKILELLKPLAMEFVEGKLVGEQMFLNASFLVSKGQEIAFDNQMAELGEQLGEDIKIKYVGPLAPYNFVDLGITQESWEA